MNHNTALRRQRAEQLAATLPPLLVAAERVAAIVAQGVHGRRRVGSGETFWQYRRYQPGDAAARIDWRQSAKGRHVFIRENEWEAAESVWLWRDGSPSMRYRSHPDLPEKKERADVLLLAVASLLLRAGEHVALMGADIGPASGRGVLSRMTLALSRPETRGGSLPPFEPLPRHARLVLVGDFLSPISETEALLRRFAAGGVQGHLLQILDPAEETLPFAGRIRFEGLEEEGGTLISRVERVRREYQARLAAHHDELTTFARHTGWSFATHRTDRPPQTALLALYTALSEPARVRQW